jgi:arylsulfatase A-like enzyme
MNRRSFISKIGCAITSILAFGNVLFCSKKWGKETKPNILWIVAEDMSPHWSCYGEKTIKTPHIDQLAKEGIRFTQAFATGSVSSPSRSALISGMYQTTIGAHHHRSQRKSEETGNLLYQESYQKVVKLMPELLQEVGYFTVLGGSQEKSSIGKQLSKSDYNFIWNEDIYDANDWSMRQSGQPFFAQIQLPGGKARKSEVSDPVNPDNMHVPPYYPDHHVMREDCQLFKQYHSV